MIQNSDTKQWYKTVIQNSDTKQWYKTVIQNSDTKQWYKAVIQNSDAKQSKWAWESCPAIAELHLSQEEAVSNHQLQIIHGMFDSAYYSWRIWNQSGRFVDGLNGCKYCDKLQKPYRLFRTLARGSNPCVDGMTGNVTDMKIAGVDHYYIACGPHPGMWYLTSAYQVWHHSNYSL